QPMQSQVFFAFIQRLKNEHAQLHLALSQQAQIVNQAREVLKQAVIKKKSLELLKEKETKRFVKKIEKLEELNLAEITLARMVHRQ
ncbi:MAG: flagellar export protein FliJ, partial [Cyanobacteria bacterium]|nr:flagellar export protein FliJ [Cyanobacteriota bacterium]